MFNALELVKEMYIYAYRKDNRLYSPIAFEENTLIPFILPMDNDSDKIIIEFVKNTLKSKILKIDSKENFFKVFERFFYLSESLEEVLSSEEKINSYLENMKGYHDYDKDELWYITYSGTNDGIQHTPMNKLQDVLKWELQDCLEWDVDFEEYIINEIAMELQKCIDVL